MKEIGNYFELECANFSTKWLKNKILLNSGRSALRYIIRSYNIKIIWIPRYTCPFIWDVLKEENCEARFYSINKNFLPKINFNSNDFILYNNYFGICDTQVKFMIQKYPNLIIDNTQALYAPQQGLASFYSLRKFFGVPDGGFAYCEKQLKENLEKSMSYSLCTHLLKIYDVGLNNSYINFIKNELILDKISLKEMSNLTKNLLKNVNYNKIRKIRLTNFNFLHEELAQSNELKIHLTENDVPMVYPYLIKNDLLKEELLKNNIHLISCWPNIDKILEKDELYLKTNLLCLPLSQRLNKDDLNKMLKIVKSAN